ncbi:MAG TPA: PAS domain-containing protein [Steroidobacter sp.]|uniref:PAS domain-containing sensor histidine kinase n=1 Tax=Steroidobacter sp. TaxID=1978227 RepID=UPI002EDADC8D
MNIELSRIVDALPALIWTVLPDGRAEFVNCRWREYTGVSTALGDEWRAAIHPDDRKRLDETDWSLDIDAEVGEHEARLRRSDGQYRWFLLRISRLLDDAGRVGQLCVIACDADERGKQEGLAGPDGRLRRFVEGLPTQMIFLTPAGELEYVNREVLDYYGKSLEELKDWATSDVIHREDLPREFARLQRTLAYGEPYDSHNRMRRGDGVYRWFRSRMLPSRDAHGNIVRYCSVQTDVHELKQAETLLTGEVQLLEMVARGRPLTQILDALCRLVEKLADQCVCSVVLVDTDGSDLRVGVDPEPPSSEFTSKSSMPILSSRDEVLGFLSIHYRKGASCLSGERELIDRFAKIAGISIERAQADAALRASETALKRAHMQLIEAQRISQTGSFTWDVHADEHIWSDEIYRIFNFEPGMPVNLPMIQAAIHPEDMPAIEAVIGRAAEGSDFDVVFRIRTSTGAIKHAHVAGHRSDQFAGRLVFVGALRDITERKIADEALHKARSELTQLARVMSLGALTASIAHEVNQPLAGIMTNASTCLSMLAADPPNVEGARITTQRTLRDGNRASAVIKQLRALFARKQPAMHAVDLNDAAREVLTLLASELHRGRVRLRTSLDGGLPLLRGDRVQLQQVILNLIVNAIDAMREVDDRPRDLLVATSLVEGNAVSMSVSDSGVGLGIEHPEKLFDAFYTTKAHGMGVGLSISRSIVESHQGRIWASDNQQHGATFTFTIPRELPREHN